MNDLSQDLIFRQLYDIESSTYTYLLADANTREAVLIDTVLENVDRDLKLVVELKLMLIYVLDTHVHADHITGAGEIRRRMGAKTVTAAGANVDCADVNVKEGDEIRFGRFSLRALSTPGHTANCLSYYSDGMVFTGDALTIRGAGRTDFQGGSAERLYESIHTKLFTLPKGTFVFPAHDYKGHTRSSIAEEIEFNARAGMGNSKEKFIEIMKNLNLATPKKMHIAVPANLVCGLTSNDAPKGDTMTQANTQTPAADLTPEQAFDKLGTMKVVDVRRPDEFTGELGHIENARLATLGPDLESYLASENKNETLLFVCRSGGRSSQAAAKAREFGFTKVLNLKGGMTAWKEKNLPSAASSATGVQHSATGKDT